MTYQSSVGSDQVAPAYLRFEEALTNMRNGWMVTRAVWVEKAVCLGEGNLAVPANALWNRHTNAMAKKSESQTAAVSPYFIQLNLLGVIQMGWTPTQEDLLAEDWFVMHMQPT
jgi:Protein of unknown function (DUF2829)